MKKTQQIKSNIYYINNENKTINKLKKTIILSKETKYDTLDYYIILDTITFKTKNYNKNEFKKIKALNYDFQFYTSLKELDGYLLLSLSFEFVSLNLINNNKEILKLINEIITNAVLDEKDLLLTIDDYQNYYKQIEDNNDKYAKFLLEDSIFQNDKLFINYNEAIDYLENINKASLFEKFSKIVNSKNYYVAFEGSEQSKTYMMEYLNSLEQNKLDISNDYKANISFEQQQYIKKRNGNQVSIALSYQKENLNIKDEYKLRLLNYIFGGSSYSLLFKNVREKENICYSIYTQPNEKYGINVYTGVDLKNQDFAISKIEQQFEKIKAGEIEQEFEVSKQKYLSNIKQEQNKFYYKIVLLEKKIIRNNENYNVDYIINQIESITIDDIKNLANDMKLIKKVIIN